MNRITEKRDGFYYDTDECTFNYCSEKLGPLEDIEEELGIELEVLFSALKNGVYYFNEQGQLIRDYVWLVNNYIGVGTPEKLSFSFLTYSTRQTLLFENYGKTWSVYKQTLEAKDELL